MSCEHPLLAVRVGTKSDGKAIIKIMPDRVDQNILSLESRYGKENLLLLPCGCCLSCKSAHQKMWSVRCALEASYHKENCMVTLTYTDERRPKKLIKRDFQNFIKDLRNRGIHFRYFGCGEYGSLSGNCHFHIILFGYWPNDARFEYNSKSGYPLYSSRFLSSVWKNGIIMVSEMSVGTAAYVAGYVDKKIGEGEFVLMSLKPGIGQRYFEEHQLEIYRYDNLVGSFGVAKVPRYFDKLAERSGVDLIPIKEKRLEASDDNLRKVIQDHSLSSKDEGISYQGRLMKDKLQKKRRSFEG